MSYAHPDVADVYPEIEALQRADIDVYYDQGIHPGRAWQDELAAAIEGCALFVLFLTEHAAASQHCRRELTFALARERPVLGVFLTDVAVPAWIELAIGDRQAIFRQDLDTEAFRARLSDGIRHHLLDAPPPPADRGLRPHAVTRRGGLRVPERAGWAAAVALLGLALAWLAYRQPAPPAETPTTRFAIAPDPGTAVYAGYDQPLALSPDGRTLLFLATDGAGVRSIWRRPLDSDRPERIPETDGAKTPFWSADGQWIGFFADGALKKVPAEGGVAQIVAPRASTVAGAAWSPGGDILFAPAPTSPFSHVSASGGPLTRLDSNGSQLWPQFIGDGDDYLYVRADGQPIKLEMASLAGGSPVVLMEFRPSTISTVAYVPGYVLFAMDDGLFAHRFDERRRTLVGQPMRLLDGVPVTGLGRAPFAASRTGVLAYWPYPFGEPAALEWFDRRGVSGGIAAPIDQRIGFALDPGMQRVVSSKIGRDGRSDLYIRDLKRQAEWPRTDSRADFTPLWERSGAGIVFASARFGPPDVFRLESDSLAEPTRVEESPAPTFPSSFTPDGHGLVLVELTPQAGADLIMLDTASGTRQSLPVNTQFNETHGDVSPDGSMLLYVSDQTGSREVWLADLPDAKSRTQVSAGGGQWPRWSPRGDEVFFVADGRRFMHARVTRTDRIEIGAATPLFDTVTLADSGVDALFPTINVYAVADDGERFLMASRGPDPGAPPIRLVLNWQALLPASR